MTKIQWTDLTRNPIKRKGGGNYCEKISPGCANCYASGLNSKGTRFGGNGQHYRGRNQEDSPEMALNIEMSQSWARMTKSKKIFVGSMTDVFGEWVPDEMIYRLLDAMASAPLQIFQLLTKRPERAKNVIGTWLNTWASSNCVFPPNIWLGISAEDQQRLDERLPWLIRTPSVVRFLSLEPLLGPIDLPYQIGLVDWIIIGGESGPNARPLELEWIEDILDQCKAANIPAFVKQAGEYRAKEDGLAHKKGGEPKEWPPALRVRMFPGEAW